MIAEYPLDMRRLMIALAVVVTVAGCGSGTKPTSVSLSTPGTSTSAPRAATTAGHGASTTTAAPSPTNRYPAWAKKDFMTLCLKRGSRSACDCALTYTEDNISFERLRAESTKQVLTLESKAAGICAGL